MRKIIVLLANICCILTLNAQDFSAEYTKATRDNDKTRQKEILAAWEKSETKNADYYLLQSEFDFTQAFDVSTSRLDVELLDKALKTADKGIEAFSDRFDLRYNKISMYGACELWDEYTEEVIKTIDRSYLNDNKWIMPGEKVDKNYFLKTMQQLQSALLQEIDLENPSNRNSQMLNNARKISERILKYYPDDADNLNNLAATYFYANEYEKALEIFLKAEKLSPKDPVILLNIANIYAKQGNKDKAKQYYNNIINNCDRQAASQANQLLKEL